MHYFYNDLVLPLRLAEHHLLQLLLEEFKLTRSGAGARLAIRISPETPTIWTREARQGVLAKMRQLNNDFAGVVSTYQLELDRFLVNSIGREWTHCDPSFPFRYASGGALPVITLGEKDYYCLFYREVRPIGWNLANGGCDTIHELVNPFKTVERELREELIILDLENEKRYVFSGSDTPLHLPEFVAADRMWEEHLKLGIPEFLRADAPLKWLDGPDSVEIVDSGRITEINGCFVNITAEDFGVEIDRIAKISVPRNVTFLDGEILPVRVMNRTVGLFDVERLNLQLDRSGAPADLINVWPDLTFFNGLRHPDPDECIRLQHRSRLIEDPAADVEPERQEGRLRLCPVTYRIIRRYGQLLKDQADYPGGTDVFICFGREDQVLAERVFKFVREQNITAFYSEARGNNIRWVTAIDKALRSAKCLIVVGTDLKHFAGEWSWAQYEWATFHAGRLRNGTGDIICFIPGIDPLTLPERLRHESVMHLCEPDVEAALRDLGTTMRTLS